MFRKIIFWTHLTLGISAGLMIAIMSFTGAALAFEKEIIAWAERDARRVEPPATNAARLPLEQILQRMPAANATARVASLAVSDDPRDAIAVGLPGNITFYANPYTGEIREGQAPRTRAFIVAMRSWHTRLNFAITPGKPSLGAKLNAAANFAFLFLCMSGLVLWWPRAWNFRVLRPSLWFARDTHGRARDWNWHNVIGFWSLPVLVVLAGSGVALSYGWAGDLVFRLAGETPPRPGGPRVATPDTSASGNAGPTAVAPVPALDSLLEAAKQRVPNPEVITLRFNPPLRLPLPNDERPPLGVTTAVVRPSNPWPPFSVTTLTFDAQTAGVRQVETFANLSAGQRARRWVRLLHTGEAFRVPGEFVAGLACLGACLLVWTGLALAWRRFFRREVT